MGRVESCRHCRQIKKTIKRVFHGFPGRTLVHSSSRRLRSRAGAHATRAWRNCCTRRWCSVHAGAFRARLQLHLFRLLLAFVLIYPPSSRVPAGAYSQICFGAFGGRIPLLGPPEPLQVPWSAGAGLLLVGDHPTGTILVARPNSGRARQARSSSPRRVWMNDRNARTGRRHLPRVFAGEILLVSAFNF